MAVERALAIGARCASTLQLRNVNYVMANCPEQFERRMVAGAGAGAGKGAGAGVEGCPKSWEARARSRAIIAALLLPHF